jgi:hypothetical protein
VPTEVDYAWAAGVIDSDGCISIGSYARAKYPDRKNTMLTVQVVNTDLRMIERFCGLFGGAPAPKKTYFRFGKVGRPQYRWVATGRKAGEVLDYIVAYLVVKGDRGRLGLEFNRLVGERGRNPLPDEVYKKRLEMATQMKELNAYRPPASLSSSSSSVAPAISS